MLNNLPVIDYEKCKQCNICVNKCPTHAIKGKEIKKKQPVAVEKPTAEDKVIAAQPKADATEPVAEKEI